MPDHFEQEQSPAHNFEGRTMVQDRACTRQHLYVCCSLDVEEEGLFGGSYTVVSPATRNLAQLERLQPILEMGVQPTLFCAWSVLADDCAWDHIAALQQHHALEIGAHLHHWNTPPLDKSLGRVTHAVPARLLDPELFGQKLDCVLELARERCGRRPVSFRMGRWDLHARHWPILARAGIECDASVRPLHRGNARNLGPNHFTAPKIPYLVPCGERTIFELPLTATPLHPLLEKALLQGCISPLSPVSPVSPASSPLSSRTSSSISSRISSRTLSSLPPDDAGLLGTLRTRLQASLQHWGALVLLPVEHPLWAMQAVTLLSVARGNPVLSLTWHSSELMPGGNPRLPDEKAVQGLVRKICAYLSWLGERFDVEYVTLSGLRDRLVDTSLSAECFPMAGADEDWRFPARAGQAAH